MIEKLRLLMPQWQGGNMPEYYLGAKLLSWLAPKDDKTPEVEVPIQPYDGTVPHKENGVVAQSILLQQMNSARHIIDAYKPRKIIVFGGDCHVSQAPFAYLNEIYDGRLGVLWVDAHPDVSTPDMHPHEHAMVLGNLLGAGDKVFSDCVKRPIDPKLVMYAGLQEMLPRETEIVERFKLRKADSSELADTSKPVLDWIAEKDIKHLAVHLDLDVLDPLLFRALGSAKPDAGPYTASKGKMSFEQVSRLLQDVSEQTDVAGLSIAEHLPWDAINLQDFLKTLPIFN